MKKIKQKKFKSSSKELAWFEQIKLEETKVLETSDQSQIYQNILHDLQLQLQNTTNIIIRAKLKKQIKQLMKKIKNIKQ